MDKSKIKIMIVDDDKSYLEEIESTLKEEGYETLVCQDSSRTLSTIQESRPRLVLLDVRMPALDGQDLLLLIRRKYPDLPVIICTGLTHIDSHYLLKSGASEVLLKPFSHTALLGAIEQAVSGEGESIPMVLHGFNLKEIRDSVLRKVIVRGLSRSNFNVTHTATLLGISRQCLLRYIKRLQITY